MADVRDYHFVGELYSVLMVIKVTGTGHYPWLALVEDVSVAVHAVWVLLDSEVSTVGEEVSVPRGGLVALASILLGDGLSHSLDTDVVLNVGLLNHSWVWLEVWVVLPLVSTPAAVVNEVVGKGKAH